MTHGATGLPIKPTTCLQPCYRIALTCLFQQPRPRPWLQHLRPANGSPIRIERPISTTAEQVNTIQGSRSSSRWTYEENVHTESPSRLKRRIPVTTRAGKIVQPTLRYDGVFKNVPTKTSYQLWSGLGIDSLISYGVRQFNKGPSLNMKVYWKQKQYLQNYGYTQQDLLVWVHILAREDGINILTTKMAANPAFTCPVQVLYQYLRRPRVSAASLYVICKAFERYLSTDHAKPIQDLRWLSTYTEAFDRFMWHARMVAPILTSTMTGHMLQTLIPTRSKPLDHRSISLITQQANHIMSLIAWPTSFHPFRNAGLQEAALIQVLQFMTDYDPPLLISSKGYEAFARVQMLLPKTKQEQLWAKLKALSWPPWKQDRTAMDSDLDPSSGYSKAKVTLDRMAAEGFSPTAFQHVAAIYTGHDTDGTPTIQTRVVVPDLSNKDEDVEAWAARIRVTRTIQEAWACWLSYAHRADTSDLALPVIRATMEKLSAAVAEQRHRGADRGTSEEQDDYDEILPGDAIELAPLPRSAHLHTFTETAPPQLWDFFIMLKARGVEMDESILSFLVGHVTQFAHGVKLFETSEQLKDHLRVLTTPNSIEIAGYSPITVAAIAELLLRFPRGRVRIPPRREDCPTELPRRMLSLDFRASINARFQRAIWLLTHNRSLGSLSQDTLAWRPVFSQLNSNPARFINLLPQIGPPSETKELEREVPYAVRSFHLHRARVMILRVAQQAIALMDTKSVLVDDHILDNFARILSRAGDSHRWALHQQAIVQQLCQHSESGARTLPYDLILDESNCIAKEQPFQYLMNLYDQLTGRAGMDVKPPAGAIWPLSPTTMHLWIRAIGTWGHHEALRQFVQWVCAEQAVVFDADKTADRRHLRRAIIAIRVFLEYVDPDVSRSYAELIPQSMSTAHVLSDLANDRLYPPSAQGAPAELIADVRSMLRGYFGPELGRWPDEEQMEGYIEKHLLDAKDWFQRDSRV